MYRLLDLLLRRIVRAGDLKLIDSRGQPHRYGDGGGAAVVVRIADKRLERRLLLDPHLALGEGYMNGQLRMERGQVYDLLALLARNVQQRPAPNWTAGFDAARFLMRRIMQFNSIARARRNVARHYDIDGAIYDLFLDRDRQYSCGYFTDDIAGLDEAQLAKKRTYRRQARARSGPTRARHRLGVGEGSASTLPRPRAPTSPA